MVRKEGGTRVPKGGVKGGTNPLSQPTSHLAKRTHEQQVDHDAAPRHQRHQRRVEGGAAQLLGQEAEDEHDDGKTWLQAVRAHTHSSTGDVNDDGDIKAASSTYSHTAVQETTALTASMAASNTAGQRCAAMPTTCPSPPTCQPTTLPIH